MGPIFNVNVVLSIPVQLVFDLGTSPIWGVILPLMCYGAHFRASLLNTSLAALDAVIVLAAHMVFRLEHTLPVKASLAMADLEGMRCLIFGVPHPILGAKAQGRLGRNLLGTVF